jgi:uncharacterized surface protein with fasciclin (FAS1) repeats
MKSNYGKLLLTIVGLIGLVSLLIAVPSQAQREPRNPRPSIFNEPPYNRSRSAPSDEETLPTPSDEETTPTPSSEETTPTPSSEETLPLLSSETESEDLVSLMKANGSFEILLRALEAAGLVDVLKGEGPFTIFAPTDAAFAKLDPDVVEELFKPENKELLVKILNHHVVPGELRSSDLQSGEVISLIGDPISVRFNSVGYLFVNREKVVTGDIPASNGVMHVIGTVILPPSL